jgi:SAM-dependent methyltransferase
VATHRDLVSRLLPGLDPAHVDGWLAATAGLAPAVIARLAAADRFRAALDGGGDPAGALHHLGPEAIAACRATGGDAVELARRDVLAGELLALDDGDLRAATLADTELAVAALEALRDPGTPLAARVAAAWPLCPALALPRGPQVEHAAPPAGVTVRPLLDHVATRCLGRALRSLEHPDAAGFPPGPSSLDRERDRVALLASAGLLPAVRAAMLHLDVAKGGDERQRAAWTALGVDLSVHNAAAARLVERAGVRAAWPLSSVHGDLALAVIESHGLAGQTLRGETPRALLAPFVAYLRSEALALAAVLGVDRSRAVELACDALHVVNVCDTAAVRDGLVDDGLLAELVAVRDLLADHGAGGSLDVAAIEDELAVAEDGTWRGDDAGAARSRLIGRLCRLRQGRQRAGEPRADVEAAVAALGDAEAIALATALRPCQLWYCEAATGELSPSAQIAVLAAVAGAARAAALSRGVGLDRPWHAVLQPLVARLHGGGGEARYRRRLVEAAVAGRAIGELLDGSAVGPLGTLVTEIGGGAAIAVDYRDSEEAAALVRLLAIYETKSSARFHALLKVLCDLYGLRKDEFDRVANEAAYLATMNAARSDKERMIDFVRPGRIVEVGPGGGVVLDLLEARFPASEIIGLDASAEVVAALGGRRAREQRRWRVVHGDAFALAELVGAGTVDTVVLCSVLHEIYSYVERAGDDGVPRRFRLEPVRDLVRQAWDALVPGGRLVIRDGVAPPPGVRRLRLIAPDMRDLLLLFAAEFEGRRVVWRDLPDGRVEMDGWDAMEFLYTYTWGPESFPYEVREQYGVLPYESYVAHLVDWLGGPTAAHALPLPPAMRSYLQPGYRDGLAGKVEVTDGDDRPVALPDSNCLIVIEKA